MSSTNTPDQIAQHFKANPLSPEAISLAKDFAINEFLSIDHDADPVFDFILYHDPNAADFKEQFEQAFGERFMPLQTYEDFSIETLRNMINDLFASFIKTTQLIILKREA